MSQEDRHSVWTRCWIGLSLIGLVLVAYGQIWGILPAADDFSPPLYDILVGRRSLYELVMQTRQEVRIRPLQSFLYWLLAELAGTGEDLFHPRLHAVIHGAHLVLFMTYAALVLTIAKRFLGWSGSIVAVVTVILHPVGVAGVASVDGLTALLSAVAVWGSLAFVIYHPRALGRSLALALTVLTIGFWQKEYVLAMVALLPLALWALPLGLEPQLRRKNAVLFAIALLALAGALLALRYALFPLSLPGLITFSTPVPSHEEGGFVGQDIIRNVGLLSAGLAFVGNSAALALRVHPAWSWVEVAWSVAFALGVVAGVRLLIVNGRGTRRERLSLVGFTLLALPLSLVPQILVVRLSEIYVTMALLPWGLFVGMAFEALHRQLRQSWRPLVIATFGLTCLLALVSTRAKVELMVESGRRAARHARLMLEQIPPEAHAVDVHIVFDERDARAPHYSVYHVNESQAATSKWALLALLPGRDLRTVYHEVRTPDELTRMVHDSADGLWLVWNGELGQYARLGADQLSDFDSSASHNPRAP